MANKQINKVAQKAVSTNLKKPDNVISTDAHAPVAGSLIESAIDDLHYQISLLQETAQDLGHALRSVLSPHDPIEIEEVSTLKATPSPLRIRVIDASQQLIALRIQARNLINNLEI